MIENFCFDDLRQSKHYDVACYSDIGQRESQQDSGYVAACDNEILAVVCDGMGGIAGGQQASLTAVKKFIECYDESEQYATGQGTWMKNAADQVDDAVYSLRTEDGNRLGAGTTLVAVHIKEDEMAWISVGDSRLYIIRDGEMLQITSDHNYFLQLNQKLENGEIDREQYRIEAYEGEALISYAGMGGLTLKDISDEPLRLLAGDSLLLCTDGLYRALSDEKICQMISLNNTMAQVSENLAQAVRDAGSPEQDNYTYVLIHIN